MFSDLVDSVILQAGIPGTRNFLILSLDSLAHGKFEWNFKYVIFKWIFVIDGWGISYEIVLIWMSLDFTDDQSTLVQVMAWCRQTPSHYLSQCWPRSLSPYGVTRPQWVKTRTRWSYKVDSTADVGLMAQVARASTAMVLTHWPLGDFKEILGK